MWVTNKSKSWENKNVKFWIVIQNLNFNKYCYLVKQSYPVHVVGCPSGWETLAHNYIYPFVVYLKVKWMIVNKVNKIKYTKNKHYFSVNTLLLITFWCNQRRHGNDECTKNRIHYFIFLHIFALAQRLQLVHRIHFNQWVHDTHWQYLLIILTNNTHWQYSLIKLMIILCIHGFYPGNTLMNFFLKQHLVVTKY